MCSLSKSVLEGFNQKNTATRSLIAIIASSTPKILQSDKWPNLQKWLENWISGRQASVSWGGTNSKPECSLIVHGRVQCCYSILFSLFMADLPTPFSPSVCISSHEDDQHHKVGEAAANLKGYIHQVEDWATQNRIEGLSPHALHHPLSNATRM